MTLHDSTDGAAASATSLLRPTRIRYVIVAATFLAAFALYLHRFCMTYAQRYIKEDLDLTQRELGWAMSAFFLSYALAQVPSGWLSDRFGARRILTVYILVWSAFTAMMGVTQGLVMLILVRLAAGVGQAGAYPTAAAIISKWIPFRQRGMMSGLIAFGGRVGGAIAPLLVATLIVAFIPSDASLSLEPRDLLDAHEFAGNLLPDGGPSAAEEVRDIRERVWQAIDPATRELVSKWSGRAGGAAERSPNPGERGAESAPGARLPAEEVRPDEAEVGLVVEQLNRLIEGAPLVPLGTRLASVEREANRLLDGKELTALESQRLNRLLLEGAFPLALRKLYGRGWRPVMFLLGGLGIVVAAIYFVASRDRPQEHPACNQAERELIAAGLPVASPHGAVGAVPMGAILRSPSLWLLSLSQFSTTIGWTFLVTWLPRYLLEVHGKSLLERNFLATIPLMVGFVGMLFGGWLTDTTTRWLGLRWGRILPILGSRCLTVVAFALMLLEPNAWQATALFSLVAFSTDLGAPSIWAFNQDVGGRHVGSVLGWGNMWGNFGSFASPLIVSGLVQGTGAGAWNTAFLCCAFFSLIAGLAVIPADARRSIDTHPKSQSTEGKVT